MANSLFRMNISDRPCPSGLKAKSLLESQGIDFDDHVFTSRNEVEQFKEKHKVKTTPQVWLEDVHIGGYDDLSAYLDHSPSSEKSYAPVIWLFAFTAMMAIAANFAVNNSFLSVQSIEWFISFSMCALAIQKFQDLNGFQKQFQEYDLLAMKMPVYGTVYPFAEGGAGVLMIAGALNWISIPVALFIGGIGAISVYKAVYLDKRQLACACVGGDSVVPLGFVSLLENLIMVSMAFWMIFKMSVLS